MYLTWLGNEYSSSVSLDYALGNNHSLINIWHRVYEEMPPLAHSVHSGVDGM